MAKITTPCAREIAWGRSDVMSTTKTHRDTRPIPAGAEDGLVPKAQLSSPLVASRKREKAGPSLCRHGGAGTCSPEPSAQTRRADYALGGTALSRGRAPHTHLHGSLTIPEASGGGCISQDSPEKQKQWVGVWRGVRERPPQQGLQVQNLRGGAGGQSGRDSVPRPSAGRTPLPRGEPQSSFC